MGIFDTLKGFLGNGGEGHFSAEYPSAQYDSAAALIEAAATKLLELDDTGLWATFTAERPIGDAALIQTTEDTVNTCRENVDIARVLKAARLHDLVPLVEPMGDCLYAVGEPTPANMAAVVDAIFVHHFRLRPNYPVHGQIEG